MTIKKYTGKTKEEAIEAAKNDLGNQVVIMNIKEQKQKGVFGIFKSPMFEVTAAIEETEANSLYKSSKPASPSSGGNHFEAVADEQVSIPSPMEKVNEQDLKSAFREISAMVEKDEHKTELSAVDRLSRKQPKEEPIPREAKEVKEVKAKTEVKEEKEFIPLFKTQANVSSSMDSKEQLNFLKMLYNILMDNEVDEKYVNQILDDLDNVLSSGSSLDYLISNVYQKLVLKFGKPNIISLSENRPKIVFIIGPTGVGKTTTIAKIASDYQINRKNNVAFITTDTYRIAATDQLKTYADIINSPFSVAMDAEEFNKEVQSYKDMDLILVDTAGFSHKNQGQKEDLKSILNSVPENYDKEVYLVLSATTKYQDLKEIVDTYKNFTDFKLIFTKLDETSAYGNILNMKLYTNADLSYVTTGQGVPDDIEVFDSQKIVKQLLGGN